jgi:hypothetical protein
MPQLRRARRRAVRAAQVAGAYVLLTAFWIDLRLRPGRALRHSSSRTRRTIDPPQASRIHEIVSAVERAASLHPLPLRCLEQALTARVMLQWLGEQAGVVLGVQRRDAALDAHAWVEVADMSVDAARDRFVKIMQAP